MRGLAGAAVLALAACSPAQPVPDGNRTTRIEPPAPAPPAMPEAKPVAVAPALPSRRPAPAPLARPLPPPPAKPAGLTYRALGTEPFWAASVTDGVLTLERPDEPPRRFPVARSEKGGTVRLSGDALQVTIRPGPCSDGMSDFTYADSVQLAFEGGTLKGCGGTRLMADDSQP